MHVQPLLISQSLLGIPLSQEVPATVEGVMGGLGRISSADVSGSRKLIKDIQVSGRYQSCMCHATE